MRVYVVKRKASSNKELGRAVYNLPDIKKVEELLREVMKAELYSEQELSSSGKFAFETWQKEKYSEEKAWEILKQDFEDALFRVFFNQQEYTNLTEELKFQEENELVIIRLVMLAGRLW